MNREIRPFSGVTGAKSVDRLGDAAGRPTSDRQTPTKGVDRAKSAQTVQRGGSAIEQFGAPVPPEFAADPHKMQTEWGWRRFLVQTLNEAQQLAAGGGLPNETAPPTDNAEMMQKLVQTLWHTLHPLLQEPAMQGQEMPATGWMIPGLLLPLSDLQDHHFKNSNVPEKVKRMAIAEKLQLAVHSHLLPVIGSGFFYPPIFANEDRRQAVYWKAERQPVTTEQDELAQHLLISIEIQGKPMELLFIFSSSSLSLHIRTDDEQLREDLMYSQPVAKLILQSVGWDMSQFSIGKLAAMRGEL